MTLLQKHCQSLAVLLLWPRSQSHVALACDNDLQMQVSNMQDASSCFATIGYEDRMQILSVHPPGLIQSEWEHWHAREPVNDSLHSFTENISFKRNRDFPFCK